LLFWRACPKLVIFRLLVGRGNRKLALEGGEERGGKKCSMGLNILGRFTPLVDEAEKKLRESVRGAGPRGLQGEGPDESVGQRTGKTAVSEMALLAPVQVGGLFSMMNELEERGRDP